MNNKSKIPVILIISFFLTLLFVPTAVAENNTLLWYENESSGDLGKILITPHVFPSFYYGFDYSSREIFSEELGLYINKSGKKINKHEAVYSSTIKNIPFACKKIGYYDFIAWFGKPYVAAYEENKFIKGDGVFNFLDKNVLFPILRDEKTDEKKSLSDRIYLNEGYEIRFEKAEQNTYIILEKNGKTLDRKIETNCYVYKEDIKNVGYVPVIIIYFEFDGADYVKIEGVFQISEKPLFLDEVKYYGNLNEFEKEKNKIYLTNTEEIRLDRGSKLKLNDFISLKVYDTKKLGFQIEGKDTTRYLKENPSDTKYKSYEKAGEIFDKFNNISTWNAKNFLLFYDEKEQRDGKGTLFIEKIQSKTVGKGDMLYSVKTDSKEYDHSDWGEYETIKIAGESFCAGLYSNTFIKNNESFIKEGFVSKVQIDKSKKEEFRVGDSLKLSDGYSLYFKSIEEEGNDDVCTLELKRNDTVLSKQSVESGSNFVYKTKYLNKTIPSIVVHVDSVFRGKKEQVITVTGVFQISEEIIEIKPNVEYGNMKITGVGLNEIRFENKETFNLEKNSSIPIIGSLFLYVSDSEDLVFFPYKGNGSIEAEHKLKAAEKENRLETVDIEISEPLNSENKTTEVENKTTDTENKTLETEDLQKGNLNLGYENGDENNSAQGNTGTADPNTQENIGKNIQKNTEISTDENAEKNTEKNKQNFLFVLLAVVATLILFIVLYISVLSMFKNSSNLKVLSKNKYNNNRNNYKSERNYNDIKYRKMYESRSQGKTYGNYQKNSTSKNIISKLFNKNNKK